MNLSRRSFLKGAAATVGAAALGIENIAHAEAEKPALLVVYLKGGYNALFSSAGDLVGKFGVTASNVEDLGNGVVIDAGTYGTLPDIAKKSMATIGVVHGLTSHDDNQMQKWWTNDNGKNNLVELATALGGEGAIKAAIMGGELLPVPPSSGGPVSLETVLDMGAALEALGISAKDAKGPSRGIASNVLERSLAMSKTELDRSPKALGALRSAYPTGKAALAKAPMKVDFNALATAYGLKADSTQVNNFARQIAAAELMITTGSNVVAAASYSDVWDSHGQPDGQAERDLMKSRILPPLKAFLSRMLNDPNRNVVVAVMGDFARSLPDSDHQPNCAVTVFGKHVKPGNTGRVDQKANMVKGTPDIKQMWACLADLLKASDNPFGANPHAALVR